MTTLLQPAPPSTRGPAPRHAQGRVVGQVNGEGEPATGKVACEGQPHTYAPEKRQVRGDQVAIEQTCTTCHTVRITVIDRVTGAMLCRSYDYSEVAE